MRQESQNIKQALEPKWLDSKDDDDADDSDDDDNDDDDVDADYDDDSSQEQGGSRRPEAHPLSRTMATDDMYTVPHSRRKRGMNAIRLPTKALKDRLARLRSLRMLMMIATMMMMMLMMLMMMIMTMMMLMLIMMMMVPRNKEAPGDLKHIHWVGQWLRMICILCPTHGGNGE